VVVAPVLGDDDDQVLDRRCGAAVRFALAVPVLGIDERDGLKLAGQHRRKGDGGRESLLSRLKHKTS
jgi:hypothetical protein